MGKKKRKKGGIFGDMFKRRKKSALLDNLHFGRASICLIFASVFLSAVMIGTCAMSRSSLERYARINVAEAKSMLKDSSGNSASGQRLAFQGIIIGKGVKLSEACQVSKTSIICE